MASNTLTRKQFAKVYWARCLVNEAQEALGKLSDGERRDLIKDNLKNPADLTNDDIAAIVDYLRLPMDRN